MPTAPDLTLKSLQALCRQGDVLSSAELHNLLAAANSSHIGR